LIEVDIPRAFAYHTIAACSVHDRATVFAVVVSLSTREVASCATILAVGGELARSADVRRLGNKRFKFKSLIGIHLIFIFF
jgi:hypothetical protein